MRAQKKIKSPGRAQFQIAKNPQQFNVRRVSLKGAARPTKYGKRLMALAMYRRGKLFIAAEMLLCGKARKEDAGYVGLHLLCQGIELVAKGLLLLHDYDNYEPELKKIGHRIDVAIDALTVAYGLHPMRRKLRTEIKNLSQLFSNHILRYGLVEPLFIAPQTIPSDIVRRRINAVIRLAEREIGK